jgi:hypothetical protein
MEYYESTAVVGRHSCWRSEVVVDTSAESPILLRKSCWEGITILEEQNTEFGDKN